MDVPLLRDRLCRAIGIALPLMLVIVEGLYLRTRRPHYLALTRKWAKATGLLLEENPLSYYAPGRYYIARIRRCWNE